MRIKGNSVFIDDFEIKIEGSACYEGAIFGIYKSRKLLLKQSNFESAIDMVKSGIIVCKHDNKSNPGKSHNNLSYCYDCLEFLK